MEHQEAAACLVVGEWEMEVATFGGGKFGGGADGYPGGGPAPMGGGGPEEYPGGGRFANPGGGPRIIGGALPAGGGRKPGRTHVLLPLFSWR